MSTIGLGVSEEVGTHVPTTDYRLPITDHYADSVIYALIISHIKNFKYVVDFWLFLSYNHHIEKILCDGFEDKR